MAIAHVAKGTTQKIDAGLGTFAIPLPAGHASGHLLFLFSSGDDNANIVTGPPGWTKLVEAFPGLSGGFLFYARTEVWYRIDDGSLGSSVNVTYSTATWPSGNGSTMVWTEAYSGCDTTGPIDGWNYSTTTNTAAAQAHPQFSTVAANCWLLTYRASYANTARTFTDSVGTDVERADDNFNGVHAALYDSNAALGAGLFTQRTTTASGITDGGSVLMSIAIKPSAVAGSITASAGVAEASGTAHNATVNEIQGTWGLCSTDAPVYSFKIDWDGDGTFTGNATVDTLPDITVTYGRDQERQLNPAAVGNAAFNVINADRQYSPEYAASPLFGDLDPARQAKFEVVWHGTTYPLFRGRIDNYDVQADRSNRTVSFTFLDGLADLQGRQLSTGVYSAMRTGDLINTILDLVGWTAGRSIDPGASVIPYWWEEGTNAFDAINKLVRSEGPPAIAYVGPDGTFIFKDRHHRLLDQTSLDVQGIFSAGALFDCTATVPTDFDFTPPFIYSNGWRDITNVVNFDVSERSPDAFLSDVWTSEGSIPLAIGESATINATGSDPFTDAVVPVLNTDYTLTGGGTASITISRTSGQGVAIQILAIGGSIVVSGLKLRARLIPVRRTTKVSQSDPGSITNHGEKSFPEDAPWANVEDARAIANMILLHYANRRPTIQLRVVSQDPAHLQQILSRSISDRIHVRNDELGLNADFFIEKITHTVQRINSSSQPPMHSVVFGCEKGVDASTNPFTFDLPGAGFDDGVFDPISSDNPTTVFIFDNANNGRFDFGMFGT